MRLTFCEGILIHLRIKQVIWSLGISAVSLSLASVAMASDGVPATTPVDSTIAQTGQPAPTADTGAGVHVAVNNTHDTSGRSSDSANSTTATVTTSSSQDAGTTNGTITTGSHQAASQSTNQTGGASTDVHGANDNGTNADSTNSTTVRLGQDVASETAHDTVISSNAIPHTATDEMPKDHSIGQFDEAFVAALALPVRPLAAHVELTPATIPAPSAPVPAHIPEPINLPGSGLFLSQLGSLASVLSHSQLASAKFPAGGLALLLTAFAVMLLAVRFAVTANGSSFVAWLRRAGYAHAARGVTIFFHFATSQEVSPTAVHMAANDSFFSNPRSVTGIWPWQMQRVLGIVGGKQ